MTEYTATCRISSDDEIVAAPGQANSIHLTPTGTYVELTTNAARTFARGILALADELDGVEAPAVDVRPKVGDRVRVVEDDPCNRPGEFVGKIGTLTSLDPEGWTRFRVQFGDGTGRHGDAANGTWCVNEVEPAPEDESAEMSTDEPANSRAMYLKQAEDMASGYIDNAYDLVAVARFLACE